MDTKQKDGRTPPRSNNGAMDVHVHDNGNASNSDSRSTNRSTKQPGGEFVAPAERRIAPQQQGTREDIPVTNEDKRVAPIDGALLTAQEQETIELTDEELDLVAGGLTRPLIVNGSVEATHLFRREPNRNGLSAVEQAGTH